MELIFNRHLANNYKSNAQIARVLSEDWILRNSYCLYCGNENLSPYKRNNPAADFYCSKCCSDYELKSFKTMPKYKIVDGAYNSMISKIKDNINPNFLFLHYDTSYSVINYFSIPKYFFTPDLIEKRKPLSQNAIRANWVGCNIIYNQLPKSGIIYIIKDRTIVNSKLVLENWNRMSFIQNQNLTSRSWLIELLALIDKGLGDIFSLTEVYFFEEELKRKFPKNNFIREKIRQQLQVLRNRGLIKFIGKGLYKKELLNGK